MSFTIAFNDVSCLEIANLIANGIELIFPVICDQATIKIDFHTPLFHIHTPFFGLLAKNIHTLQH